MDTFNSWIIYTSSDSYYRTNLTTREAAERCGMNEKEVELFVYWFDKTFPSTQEIKDVEKEINHLIPRFYFKFVFEDGDNGEFIIYRKRWFDKLFVQIKQWLLLVKITL